MPIKVVENKKESKGIKYPCLMGADDGLVVLFTYESRGVAVSSSAGRSIGSYSCDWDMKYFTPYEGSITLSNEE